MVSEKSPQSGQSSALNEGICMEAVDSHIHKQAQQSIVPGLADFLISRPTHRHAHTHTDTHTESEKLS